MCMPATLSAASLSDLVALDLVQPAGDWVIEPAFSAMRELSIPMHPEASYLLVLLPCRVIGPIRTSLA